MMRKAGKSKQLLFFLAYTGVFVAIVSAFYMIFSVKGRTLVSSVDGVKQHYKALIYYSRYLRSIFENLAAGNGLVIPQWEFNLGEGNDILQTLHYYVIGDPFAFFSFLVPERFMYFYYDGMIMLRMYCAGLSFAFLCSVTGENDFGGKLVGSIAYAFCFWAIRVFCRHPYFLNPLIYYPLLIAGIELILKGERSYLFIAAVMISALSNFYFFYILVLLTVLYAVVRYLVLLMTHSVEVKKLLCLAGKTILASAVGAALAGVILLPVLRTFIMDSRSELSYAFHWFYPFSYYLAFPGRLVSSMSEGEYVLLLGYSPILLFAVFLLFRDRKNGTLKILFLTGLLFACFPLFGKILNGNAYITNRWSWAFAVLCCYLLVIYWQKMIHPDPKTAVRLAVLLAGYSVICWWTKASWKQEVWISLLFAASFLGFTFVVRQFKILTEKILQSVLIFAVCIFLYCSFLPRLNVELSQSMRIIDLNMENNETSAVKQIAEEENVQEFFRFSGKSLTYNAGILNHLSSTSYYWTNSNPAITEYRKELGINDDHSYKFRGYDVRATLETLASTLYYVIPENKKVVVPYGFTYIDTIPVKMTNVTEDAETGEDSQDDTDSDEGKTDYGYKVYRNNNYLSIGYGYSHFISYSEWSKMNPAEKEEAMLKGVVLDRYDGDVPELHPELSTRVISGNEYDIHGMEREGDTFIVTDPDSGTITVKLDPEECSEGAEYDLRFRDMDCEYLVSEQGKPEKYSVLITTPDKRKKTITFQTPEYRYYTGRKDILVSLGYFENLSSDINSGDVRSKITIKLEPGRYSFSGIDLIKRPMAGFDDEAYELYENSLTDVQIGTDTVSGKITADEPMMMCFSIPYSDGWKATVDGKEAKVWKANVKNMAVEVGTGEHEIRLTYSCPWKKEGLILSAMGLLAFAVLALAEERKRRQGKMQNEN